ncbi:hypothetical protein ACA910_016573 [Epithemia clementina (nom. ined.)]
MLGRVLDEADAAAAAAQQGQPSLVLGPPQQQQQQHQPQQSQLGDDEKDTLYKNQANQESCGGIGLDAPPSPPKSSKMKKKKKKAKSKNRQKQPEQEQEQEPQRDEDAAHHLAPAENNNNNNNKLHRHQPHDNHPKDAVVPKSSPREPSPQNRSATSPTKESRTHFTTTTTPSRETACLLPAVASSSSVTSRSHRQPQHNDQTSSILRPPRRSQQSHQKQQASYGTLDSAASLDDDHNDIGDNDVNDVEEDNELEDDEGTYAEEEEDEEDKKGCCADTVTVVDQWWHGLQSLVENLWGDDDDDDDDDTNNNNTGEVDGGSKHHSPPNSRNHSQPHENGVTNSNYPRITRMNGNRSPGRGAVSSNPSTNDNSNFYNYQDNAQEKAWRRKQGILLFWFVMVALSYAGERCTFKILVDRAGPFRLFSVEMVTALHALLLALGLLLSLLWQQKNQHRNRNQTNFGCRNTSRMARRRRQQQQQQQQQAASLLSSSMEDDDDDDDEDSVREQNTSFSSSPFLTNNHNHLPLGLPLVDVGLMALLDVVSLMLVFLTGSHVSPVLTVVLVQGLIPATSLLMQGTHADGCFRTGSLGGCCGCRPRPGSARPYSSSSLASSTPESTPSPSTTTAMTTLRGTTGVGGGVRGTNMAQNNNSNNSSSKQAGTARKNVSNSSSHNNSSTLSPAAGRSGSNRSPPQSPHQLGDEPLPSCAGLTPSHVWGSWLIAAACVLVLLPSWYTLLANAPWVSLAAKSVSLSVAYNSVVYFLASIPAASSQLYKEHVFLQYKQPVPMHKVNLLLSVFQFLFVSLLSPLVYTLQGVGWVGQDDDGKNNNDNNNDEQDEEQQQDWLSVYPSTEFSDNFQDGLFCFFRILDKDDQLHKYPEEARCDWVLSIVLLHTLCIIAVGVAVDRLIHATSSILRMIHANNDNHNNHHSTATTTGDAGGRSSRNSRRRSAPIWTVHRGIGAGIVLAVVGMAMYNVQHGSSASSSPSRFQYGPWIQEALNVTGLIVLLIGFELYHRVELPELTFETEYPRLDNLYDEQEA